MRKQSGYLFLATCVGAIILSGCVTQRIPLMPQASGVQVINASTLNGSPTPAMPVLANCQLKGHILVRTMAPRSYREPIITENEMNSLRNQSLPLAANTVVITHNAIVNDGNNYVHLVKGDAYLCGVVSPVVDDQQ